MEVHFIVFYGNIYGKTQQVDETNLDRISHACMSSYLGVMSRKKGKSSDTPPIVEEQ